MMVVLGWSRASSGAAMSERVVGESGRARKRTEAAERRAVKGTCVGLEAEADEEEEVPPLLVVVAAGEVPSLRWEMSTFMPRAVQRRAICFPFAFWFQLTTLNDLNNFFVLVFSFLFRRESERGEKGTVTADSPTAP